MRVLVVLFCPIRYTIELHGKQQKQSKVDNKRPLPPKFSEFKGKVVVSLINRNNKNK